MSARVVTSGCAHGAEHDVGGDDGAALEEERGGGGLVQAGHLQHGRVSIHRHPCQATCITNTMFISLNVFLEFCVW